MSEKYCHIILVGHHSEKLIMSIDKERNDKIIYITEKKELSGTKQAAKTLQNLVDYYSKRKVEVEKRQFSFDIQMKPIAELTHLIYQQKLIGFNNIKINLSGGLRYIIIWFYLAGSITRTKVIHADYIYEEEKEVGIIKNDYLITIPFGDLTTKQIEFLELFFPEFNKYEDFFSNNYNYDDNPLLNQKKSYNSIEELRMALVKKRGIKITRGSVNGFIQKLNLISALEITPLNENKKMINLNYLGIAYFLHNIYNKFSLTSSTNS